MLTTLTVAVMVMVMQHRIYHGAWVHGCDSCHFALAVVVTRELDQGFVYGQRRLSTRVVHLCLLLFGLVLFAIYNGALTSRLAISQDEAMKAFNYLFLRRTVILYSGDYQKLSKPPGFPSKPGRGEGHCVRGLAEERGAGHAL